MAAVRELELTVELEKNLNAPKWKLAVSIELSCGQTTPWVKEPTQALKPLLWCWAAPIKATLKTARPIKLIKTNNVAASFISFKNIL